MKISEGAGFKPMTARCWDCSLNHNGQQKSFHTFDKFRIDNFLPSVLALDIRAIRKVAGDEVPTLALDLHQTLELLILGKKNIG